MRFVSLLLLTFFVAVLSVHADTWDDFSDIDRAWDGQKTITNKEFEEVIDALQANEKKVEEKKQRKLFKKITGGGKNLHTESESPKSLKEIPEFKKNEDGILVNIPVTLYFEGKPLEKGFYKILGEKDKENNIRLNFYQSQFLKGTISATETQEDFDEDKIDFAKIIPYNESFMKIIFGSIDFNAYTYLPFSE